MLIKATLSNARHPEYGEVTIPFPIKTSEYDHTMEMLANLEIGNVMGRDCKIMELSSPYSILQKLEGSEVNIDELDYLAKRLESFEADQDLQFQAAAFARGVTSIEDFINLTFCSDQATVIYDFTNLEAVGRQHFMNLHGGCASMEELENLDGYETALLLIDGGGAEITPYGVLYDNGMQMEQLYKGGSFPPYLYDAYELVLPISPAQDPQNKTYLYLPSSDLQLERTLLRGEIMEREGWFHKLEPIQLSGVIIEKLDTRRDSIRELNEMCRSIHQLSHADRAKLDAAVEYTHAQTARQIRQVTEHLDQFDFAPGVHPQLLSAKSVCARIAMKCMGVKLDNLPQRLLAMFQFYCTCMEENKLGTAMDCIEEVAAMSLQVVLRECRQLGTDLTITQGEQFLQSRILPHQNRGKLKNRTDEISALIQRAVDQSSAPGIRGEAEKRAIAGAWLDLAIACAKVSVKQDADERRLMHTEEPNPSGQEQPMQAV